MTALPSRVRPSRVRPSRVLAAAALLSCGLALSGCASGTLATPESTASATSSSATSSSIAGPTILVTVPDLVTASTAPAVGASPVTPESAAPAGTASPATTGEPAPAPDADESSAVEAAPTTEAPAEQPAPAPVPAEPAQAPGDALNVSLANCDGCAVLATHRGVTGDLSAALVSTGSGRAILLSVAGDGQVSGVIGIPYGAAFAAPAGGVLACAQGRCVVEGRQTDGRAVLSAFELTETGAWRDVSGDDAFPSATELAAVIDLDGELAIAVQDQASGAAVWMLYTWDGERYSVVGCTADGAAPTSVGAVSPEQCLS